MDWKSKRVTALLEAALVEDRATEDETTRLTIDPSLRASASILAKEDCVVSGLGCIPAFLEIFARLSKKPVGRFDVISHPEIFDGVRVKKGQALAVIRHNAASILSCERVILNVMQRMSGIATLTAQYVREVKGTKVKVLDTRKTLPGMRLLEKYAVACGGGTNHRQDLHDGVLIKNNHISLGGGIPTVLKKALEDRRGGQKIQVEVRTFTELDQALLGGAESLLLDNMTPAEIARAVKVIRKRAPGVSIEASGNMNLKTIGSYAKTGVDFISVGALTHSAVAVDLSMKITADVY